MTVRTFEKKDSIIDASVPSAGRIYDYLLGGHHNFEVDRQAAEQVIALQPFMPKVMRLQRWCLQDIAEELTVRRGFDTIIDFASGLPTNDHLHHVVPEGTTVIYSDYDPVVVEYAQEILGDTPNVYFFKADAARPEELLHRPQVEEILGGKRDVALIYWGISIFLTDEELIPIPRTLYDWAGPGSCWVFNAQAAGVDPNEPAMAQVISIYEQMGAPVYIRSVETYRDLLRHWRPDEQGFISLLEWHGFDQSEMSTQDRKAWGPAGAGYGAYLVK
jgi:hypothetical protein